MKNLGLIGAALTPVRNVSTCFINPDDVYGQNEAMLGFSIMNALKSGANLAFNPIAQTRLALNAARGVASAAGNAFGITHPSQTMPPPPMLNPSMGQAGTMGNNTIHAYMGLGAGGFASTGPTGDLPTFSAEPQSAFIGNRLVLAARYTDGAAGLQVTITNPLTVSGMPQTPAPSVAAPIEMFDAATTYSALDLQVATSATQISIGFSVSATPGTGDTVSVSGGLFGQWIR
jgi:hypothetical protein